ncbi:hypothetical protein TSUD_281920 [Trifolium subterraneum]|uniref:Retrotransposon gag domain-containing protein n=1 Tax=Trifolium subterraneum TaxID=3900 RepID=A0A2Z6MI48_TRISU|nr:hypothetical protein TSUD_281920 [Trifolium subterraneum]
MGENGPLNPPHQPQDGLEASITQEGSAAHAQETPLDAPPPQHVPVPEAPLVVPQVPLGAPMEVVMAALVKIINRQGQLLREQVNNMREQNDLIREQNRRIQAVENSCAASKISRSTRRHRSPTPENNRSRSRSRSPRHAPRRNANRPLSLVREHPRKNNRSSPPRDNRTPPRRNNRSPPRNGEAAVRGGNARNFPRRESPDSGDERHRGPLSRRIMDIPLPRGLEKPPSFDKYDGTTDPDEHIQSGSIDSWEELCRMFTAHFTTSRRHPKTVATLKAIIQGPEEPLRSYIERFNKIDVEVDATDKMKLYLLEDGLRGGTKFQEAVGIMEMKTLDEFFELAQRYIKWKEKHIASEVRRPKNLEAGGPSSQREERRGDEKKRDGGKSAGITFPKQLPVKPNVDKKKFCRFHKSHGHVTEDCVHLKDAIEILIQKGYARQYVDGQQRTANNPPRQNQLAIDASSPEQNIEEDNRVVGGVALAISRPEDFLPLPNNEEK